MLNFNLEKSLFEEGYKFIAGVDEVGRGPVAGPIMAAAVIMDPQKPIIEGAKDSKLLSYKKRLFLREKILENAISWATAEISNSGIDSCGIQEANMQVLKEAVYNLKIRPDFCLIDYFAVPNFDIDSKSVISGDAVIYSIACASIIAKVYRDEFMIKVHEKYPIYNFLGNKGYLTKHHLEALGEVGFCNLHRLSFWPASAWTKKLKENPKFGQEELANVIKEGRRRKI